MRVSVLVLFLLTGCATVNFSANYYVPPQNYRAEIEGLWREFVSAVPLKYVYSFHIVSDRECKAGIPYIEKHDLKIPDNFLKYTYQNYYVDRFVILSSLVAHEICHAEYGLANGRTPKEHFAVDKKAIEMLAKADICSAEDFYKSLQVMRSYWFARKGVGGHMFNVGWNVLNLACMAYTGNGYFANWFATDLEARLKLISREYKVRSGTNFKRSKETA